MDFKYPGSISLTQVKDKILDALGGRELGKMVQIEMDGADLIVRINKLGESVLRFEGKKHKDGLEINLVNEKIAFTHRAFKEEVKAKLAKIISSTGGTVIG